MKTVDARCPGVISLIVEKNNDNYLARRDFVDTYNKIHIGLFKESMKVREQTWNPVLHAGLLFFKELDIKGYKLETSLDRGIKTGLNLLEDEVIATATLKAMNDLCDTKLSEEELVLLGSKISNKIPSLLQNDTLLVNQNEEVVREDSHSKDCFYALVSLMDKYNDIDISNFFINDSIDLDKDDPRYQELLFIKNIFRNNNAKNMSMNGNSTIIISSFQDIHDRFMAYKQLKDNHYSVSQLNRSNGITMIKTYK